VKHEDVELQTVADGISRKILGYNDDIMLVRAFFQKGAIGALHSHPHRQVTYVEKGVFEVEIDGQKEILRAGDSFMVQGNVVHGAVALEDGILIDVFTPARADFLVTDSNG
jgi:quercetin dioxygenase-like cupin family protein